MVKASLGISSGPRESIKTFKPSTTFGRTFTFLGLSFLVCNGVTGRRRGQAFSALIAMIQWGQGREGCHPAGGLTLLAGPCNAQGPYGHAHRLGLSVHLLSPEPWPSLGSGGRPEASHTLLTSPAPCTPPAPPFQAA